MNQSFKYSEDRLFTEVFEYIKSTYSGHYVLDEDDDIQALDVWHALGLAEDATRATSLKYLMRYGKKDGFNRKDIFKAIHYLLLMMHFEDANADKRPVESETKTATPTVIADKSLWGLPAGPSVKYPLPKSHKEVSEALRAKAPPELTAEDRLIAEKISKLRNDLPEPGEGIPLASVDKIAMDVFKPQPIDDELRARLNEPIVFEDGQAAIPDPYAHTYDDRPISPLVPNCARHADGY